MLRTLTGIALAVALAGAATAAPRAAQPFEGVSYDGRKVSLDALKGQASVLMFFSTNCPHCQKTAYQIEPIYRELRGRGFEIVGLSLNQTDNSGLRDFARRFQASFPLTLSSRPEFSRVSGVSVMTRIYYPYILFLDKDGVIREEHQGSEQAWFDNVEVNFRRAVEALMD